MAPSLPRVHACPSCRLVKPAKHSRSFTDPSKPLLFSRRYKKRPLSDFIQARIQGCEGCDLIVGAIEAWQPGWSENHEKDAWVGLDLNESILCLSLFLARGGEPHRHEQAEQLTVFQGHDDRKNVVTPLLTKPFASTRGVVADTAKEEAFERARSWLANCVEHHACVPANAGTFRPRRLLRVRKEDAAQVDRIYLVEDEVATAPYVALSYCWGSDLTGVVRTLQSNKASHMRGIPLASLPQTVGDAVTFCRGLGLDYIWVDALCIVQDDAVDWKREAVKMADVYQHSHVTISAHAAASCQDGFLGPQAYGQKDWQRAFWTSYGARPQNKAFVRTASSRPDISEAYASGDDTCDAVSDPLSTRGWTLQEAILPRRTLHFMGDEMVWECDALNFCECGHVDGPGYRYGSSAAMVKTNFRNGMEGLAVARSSESDGWMDLVQQYARRNLTHASDKLVAIAGLAELVARENRPDSPQPWSLDEVYLAGIFRSAIPAHLLWVARPVCDLGAAPFPPAQGRPLPYRAPSWSWASVDGCVEYPRQVRDAVDVQHTEKEPLVSLVQFVSSATFPLSTASHSNPGVPPTAWDIILEGFWVPVMLATSEYRSDKKSGLEDAEFNDTEKGRLSVVRPANGTLFSVCCDELREYDFKVGDAGHACVGQIKGFYQNLAVRDAHAPPSELGHGSNDSLSLGSSEIEADEEEEEEEGEGKISNSLDKNRYTGDESLSDSLGHSSDMEGSLDMTDGSEDYGSEGRSESVMGSISIQPEEGDEAGSWQTSDDGDAEREDEARGSGTERAYCENCQPPGGYWEEPKFCALQTAKVASLGLPTEVFFLVLQRSTSVPGAWERTGLGCLEVTGKYDAPRSLFAGAQWGRIRIV